MTDNTTNDIRIVKVKRARGRETETRLMECHCVSIMTNTDDGTVVLEAYPDSSRGDGIRIYIGRDSVEANAPAMTNWARMARNGRNGK